MTTYVLLGKTGDVLSFLPLCAKLAQSGEKPGLMVAKDYAGVLDGVSYVDPLIHDGPHTELGKAVAWARSLGDDVVSVQVVGPREEVIEHTFKNQAVMGVTTGFDQEAWRVAGHFGEWTKNLPLVFDNRSPAREAALLARIGVPKEKPLVLVDCKGQSSAFPHAGELMEVLTRLAGRYHLLEVPRAERIYDLSALYERAHCLIAIDSAPLHLARAFPDLPVLALVNDKPRLWNGSSWQPNWRWSCRYSQFPMRRDEVIEVVETCRRGLIWPHVRVWNATKPEHRPHYWPRQYLPITPRMIGRDSSNTDVGDPAGVPYLKDCLNAALRRAKDDEGVMLTRPDTKFFDESKAVRYEACYAHRIERGEIDQFVPVLEMCCATARWWKEHRKELPDLLFGTDHYVWQALWCLFRKHQAADVTGVVYRLATKPAPTETPEPKRLAYNLKLMSIYVGGSGVHSRYPKVSEQIETIPLDLTRIHKRAYNPTIIDEHENLLMAYRYHQKPDYMGTALAAQFFDDNGKSALKSPLEMSLKGRGSLDDPRYFRWQGKVWLSWVDSTWPEMPPKCVVKCGCTDTNELTLNLGKNDWSSMEKNWVFFSQDSRLFVIYQCSPSHQVYEVMPDGTFKLYETKPASWHYGPVRGGTSPIPYQGKLLRFFHSSLRNERTPDNWRYYLGAYLMDPEPPFAVVCVSKRPVVYGSEVDDLKPQERRECKHWKSKIVFPGGAVKRSGHWLVSVGVNDAACAILKVTPRDLHF